jgi:hypothetical protein
MSPRLDGTYPRTAGLIRFEIFLVQHECIPQGGAKRIEGLSNSSTDFQEPWPAHLQRRRQWILQSGSGMQEQGHHLLRSLDLQHSRFPAGSLALVRMYTGSKQASQPEQQVQYS